ncbi:bifunctional non-homologous end joining protein LigD [Melghirimyces profundicolus]|uniref:Bifunctional non-homologous end joining protein LigD n=1 Tax=Melghirimyces profundicolus TaxID=1242148 RepID=A0A2T6BV37_9BACL|nr:non-homologous end-joining DNA ligase [Melghirimyces profundicolus]PTX59945.1 bifunctional non-homologous end joining protein LigD [Melghirimyces profundicolus]
MQDRHVRIEGREIKISNPDKRLFPDWTKWEWILHLTRLAPYLLPYARGRYLTTIRYPDGVEGKSFYQKNIPSHAPEWVQSVRSGDVRYILLQDAPTLIWLGNLASLEFHVSFDRAERPGYPTELVFDIDPSVKDFQAVMETALLTREALSSMDLDGVVKTSGATGLQIYVPIQPRFSFEQTRRISEFLARYLRDRHPSLITLERKVKNRGHRVYFDYLQHWKGKSLITAYSPRARREATVSVPLEWVELKPGLTPQDFTLETVHQRLEEKGDLFAPISRPNHRYDLSDILRFLR